MLPTREPLSIDQAVLGVCTAVVLLAGCAPSLNAYNTDTKTGDPTDGGSSDDVPTEDTAITEDTSVPTTDSTTIPAGAVVLDPIEPFQNETTVGLTGRAEPQVSVTLIATCDQGSSGDVTATSSATGDFAFAWNPVPGETCEFYATTSSPDEESNVVSTQVCAIPDLWEPLGGDDPYSPLDEWVPLADDGLTTHTIAGNMLPGDPGDWYLVHGIDDPATDLIFGFNDYDLRVQLTSGTETFSFLVSRGAIGAALLECDPLTLGTTGGLEGYHDYNDHISSVTWGNGTACGENNADGLDNCVDMSNSYLIEVLRDPSEPAGCQAYELTVTNNAP